MDPFVRHDNALPDDYYEDDEEQSDSDGEDCPTCGENCRCDLGDE